MLPAYFAQNDWGRVVFYAVARNALEARGAGCSTCADPNLTLDGAIGYDVVLVAPGYAGRGRPSASLADYLDDAENRNDDDRFATPASQSADRDRVFAILGAETNCAAHARVLVDNAPCADPVSGVRAVCRSASSALAGCRCSAAAASLLRAPCVSGIDGSLCETAVNQLRGCTS
jgi:hypothetical protein